MQQVEGLSSALSQPADSQVSTPPVSKRELWSWALYDFANSGYATVVLTAIYSAYFVAVIAAPLDVETPGQATLLWTLAIGLANFIVLVAGPVIGAIADRRALKKQFLVFASLLCICSTAGLAYPGPDQWLIALSLLVLSSVAFALGENLIAAFLPELATGEKMGRISGYGWALGYFGGLLTLSLSLLYINHATAVGDTASDYVPVTLLITAVIFAVASLPTLIFLRERTPQVPAAAGESYLKEGLGRVAKTLRQASRLPDLFRFLACLVLFQAGVATVIVVAAIFAAQELGFSEQELIVLIMVVNFTAALGAFAFGFAQDHWGSIPSLTVALLIWIAAIVLAFFAESRPWLWLSGNLIGLAMGATQAGGRALVGRLTPAFRNAEIFGLWGLASRAAAILGPISYGIVARLSGGDQRIAMLSTLCFFVAGLLMLRSVNEARGMAAAAQTDGDDPID
ncbi:MAG: MFS transporter [Pseudomonadota bacterium]